GGMRIRPHSAVFTDDPAAFNTGDPASSMSPTFMGADITTHAGISIGNEFIGGLGLSYGIVPQKFDVVGEVYGNYGADSKKINPDLTTSKMGPSAEAIAGIKLYLARNSFFEVGGGYKVADGYGGGAPRAFVGFIFEPSIGDRDGDGYKDDVDQCPDDPEDFDDFEDADGCPDPDNDKDGIPDVDDKCPNEPETINGKDDEDGCPDKGQGEVKIGREELETLRPIFFDTDRARVRHAFYNILGQVASTLKAHPEIGRCAVEGHTDDTGPEEWNQKLSQLRAQSVVEFLVNKGVDRKRLAAIGHGEKVPWASNETPWGRAKNRRVIFHIEGVNVEDEQKQERRKKVREHKAATKARTSETREDDAPAPPSLERARPSGEKPSREKPTKEPAGAPARGKSTPDAAPASPPSSNKAPDSKPENQEATPAGRTAVAPLPKAAQTGRSKAPKAEPQNPTTLRELLKLPDSGGLDEAPPPQDGPRDLPKRRPR
ncbi:MAG: OmpA-OmpF porin, family, partial [Myxococcales bacterium]|nr:OmpA-OmpF porin, family [Myxococcales bacterium]